MVHLVNQIWNCIHQAFDFRGLSFSVYIDHELLSVANTHVTAHRPNWKVDPLKISINNYLNSAHMHLYKFERFQLVLRKSLSLNILLGFLIAIGQTVHQNVNLKRL